MAKWLEIIENDENGYPFVIGVRCSNCGYQTIELNDTCPKCKEQMDKYEM